mgnify:CR=1 FL=1
MLRLGEDELPATFDPSGANLDVVVFKGPTRAPALAFDLDAAFGDLWRTAAQPGDPAAALSGDAASDDADARADEIAALEATYDGAAVVPGAAGDRVDLPGGVHVLVPRAYPAAAAVALAAGKSPAEHAALARFALDGASLYDLAELALAKAPAAAARPAPAPRAAAPAAAPRRAAAAAPARRRRGGGWWDRASAAAPAAGRPSTLVRLQREKLPAAAARDEILGLLREFQVLLIEGGTGCGKTTQVPQFLLDDARARGVGAKVVVAQPRRLAAVGVSARVADERGEDVGRTVGVAVRGEARLGDETQALFCTTEDGRSAMARQLACTRPTVPQLLIHLGEIIPKTRAMTKAWTADRTPTSPLLFVIPYTKASVMPFNASVAV